MNYYTLQIHYGDSKKPDVEERLNLSPAVDGSDTSWISELRKSLYTTGFAKKTSPTTYEFVSPFRIHTIFLIKQPHKYE